MLARLSTTTRAFGLSCSPLARTSVFRPRSDRFYSSSLSAPEPRKSQPGSVEHKLWTCTPSQKSTLKRRHPLRASVILGLPLVAGLACVAIAAYYLRPSKVASEAITEEEEVLVHLDSEMSGQLLPGRPGNLTPEQEDRLRQLWNLIFQVCGVTSAEELGSTSAAAPLADKEDLAKAEKKKKRSLFSRKGKKEGESESGRSTPINGHIPSLKDAEDDKYGQIKHFHETLANQSPEDIRATIWSMLKHDHPDALVLRFLRARKWDVEKALVMLVSTMNWRSHDMHVDDDIVMQGEGGAAEIEKGTDEESKIAHDFLAQIRMGKSFLHGVDKNGRPICVVRVRLHKQGQEVEASLERYTVYIIETCRMMLQNGVDTATIVFDMTGFSMANMDYTPVKFMIKCFEANYPECLGAVLVHKAPWIFQGIWRVIKGWLDPVVAGKVHFTNNMKDLEEFIPPKNIITELEGEESWEYKYVEPVPGENDRMKDAETRDRLLAEREHLYRDFENATMQWIQNPDGEAKPEREAVATKLRTGYWALDPYLRARSIYDRIGVIKEGGQVDYYPAEAAKTNVAAPAPAAPAAAPAFETTADDVD